jgi:uncharacterized membrane protein YGL010W
VSGAHRRIESAATFRRRRTVALAFVLVVGLLVGPMFVVGEVLMALGLLRRMHHDIHRLAGPTR